MFDTILFDLDGTLINNAEGITKGTEYALQALGYPPLPFAIRELFIGPPLRDSFQKYCGVGEEEAEKLVEAYRVYYREFGVHEAKPYPGIPALLEKLKNAGKKLYVATAKPTKFSRIILEEWNLAQFFEEIIGAGFDKNFDSKDKIIALAASMSQGKNILMVGDTVFDVEGARANGLPTLGVLYGFGDKEAFLAARPEYIAETVEEIGEIICN